MKLLGGRLRFANAGMWLLQDPWEGLTCALKAGPGEPIFSCIGKVYFSPSA